MSGPTTLGWWEGGEAFLAGALEEVTDLDGPSLLPGWSRRRVVAHVARNADALVNLLTWARTGEETPMYRSPELRDAAIAETATLGDDELLEDCRAAGRRLADAVHDLPEPAWAAQVRTAQGRTVPAAEVPWMRCREVWVHAVDLDSGPGFDAVPDDVLAALVDDVVQVWHRRGTVPAVRLDAGERSWGPGPQLVSGPLPELAGYVTGRATGSGLAGSGAPPALPAWL